ncbi:hydroxyisourate hydrolase [Pseudovibrio exalbescens]|uniref:hydroxyisourate hydrolase n=1 Tax=Pseudovibrio exalbescens TaxID=197461 RepID=UPI00236542F4|nr:hydroxyisourate hydrolase [Pseudovibrio exalbescens]MDD7908799.1 hydroxyisourate hydrolase [Pseudovibrio exalbescens]
MGRITTHVLDTALGRPAQNLKITLHRLEGNDRDLLGTFTTNSDGRVDTPLIEGDALKRGTYELTFHAGAYLRHTREGCDAVLFLDEIPIRFGIEAADQHYHVPLLLSPFGYSTYRGS